MLLKHAERSNEDYLHIKQIRMRPDHAAYGACPLWWWPTTGSDDGVAELGVRFGHQVDPEGGDFGSLSTLTRLVVAGASVPVASPALGFAGQELVAVVRLLSDSEVRFTVLGSVRAWRGSEEIDLGAPQQRALLALLLVRAGEPVSLGEIVDVLWGVDPPSTAVNVVHRHVGVLRRLLEPDLPVRSAGRWLVRSAGGYRLNVDADAVDVLRFRGLSRQAHLAVDADTGRAAVLFAEALELWKGVCAAGIDAGARSHPVFAAVEREFLATARAAADAGVRAGQVHRLLPALQEAAVRAPLDEPLQAGLVLALAAAGQQAEAFAVYQRVREQLADELGVDPGVELAAAHAAVLRRDPAGSAVVSPEPVQRPRPAQLPAAPATFVGRQTDLARALALGAGDETATVRVSAIGGMAGIGKTTFAIHWAYQIADRFPDGQLYLNLRGFEPSGQVVSASEALQTLLDALGVSARQIPADVEAQAALYRTVTAGQKLLLLLDNARDVEQVRPLLPGSAGCFVIITSRNQLSELSVTHNAHLLSLDLLPAVAARDFLGRRIGATRLAAEPSAVDDIVACCGGLPLALAIVAARAVTQVTFPLSAFAAELRRSRGSLEAFAGPAAAINARAVFSWSYLALTPPAAELFRLLGVHPGPDVDATAAASLVGMSWRGTQASLAELQRAHLVVEHVPGRYLCHDLVRAYAAELVDEDVAARDMARLRLADHYLHSAWRARELATPSRSTIRPPAMQAGVRPVELSEASDARVWFAAEISVLLKVMDATEQWHLDTHLWQLTWAMFPYTQQQLPVHVLLSMQERGVEAAKRSGDRVAYARNLHGLASAFGKLGQEVREAELARQSLAVFAELGDVAGQARLHLHLVGLVNLEKMDLYDIAEIRYHATQALAYYEVHGTAEEMVVVRYAMAKTHLVSGDHRLAIDQVRSALPTVTERSAAHEVTGLWEVLGRAHQALGEHTEAIEAARASIDVCRGIGHRIGEALTLDWLGNTQLDAGDLTAAHESWKLAVDIFEDLHHPLAASTRAKLAGAS